MISIGEVQEPDTASGNASLVTTSRLVGPVVWIGYATSYPCTRGGLFIAETRRFKKSRLLVAEVAFYVSAASSVGGTYLHCIYVAHGIDGH